MLRTELSRWVVSSEGVCASPALPQLVASNEIAARKASNMVVCFFMVVLALRAVAWWACLLVYYENTGSLV